MSDFHRLQQAVADRYTIEREIGHGGMATVYLADDVRHRRKVALKVLQADLARTLGPDRFLREIELAARLQHPHILPLYDSGDAEGFLYYVMPYVEGESLRQRLAREGELPVAEAVRILRDMVDALAYAHTQGVVHRDVKPDNVMLSGRHALVTDFGVAKAVSEATGRLTLTSAGVALGTPAYMAPEQAVADPHVDHRADLYAVGAVGYELLTGRPPFSYPTAQAVLAAHVTESPEPITQHREAVSPPLANLVMRCLAKKPADRPQSADDVLATLETLTTPSGGVTPTDTRPVRARPATARRLRVAGIGAGVLVLVILLALFVRPQPPTLSLGQLTRFTSAPGLEMDPAISPDGNMVAYAAGPPANMKIFVRQIAGGRTIALTEDVPGHHRWPHWSPDGSRIAFQGGGTYQEGAGAFRALGGAIYVIPALGGVARLVTPAGPATSLFGPAWSPRGDTLAYIRNDTIVLQGVDGGEPRPAVTGPLFQPHSIAWSPDGTRVAFVAGNPLFIFGTAHLANSAPSAIWVARVGGTPVQVTSNTVLNISPVWTPDGRALLFISNQDGARDLYQVPLTGSGAPRRPPARLSTGLHPHTISATRDGKRLTLAIYTMDAHIRSLPIPTGGPVSPAVARQLTAGTESIEGVTPSPDGRWIAYPSDRSGNHDVWKVPAEGGDPIQLTTHPADDFVRDWSPDGTELVFHSFRTGNRDLFVMRADGGQAQQVTSEGSEDLNATWSPDGNCVAFQSGRSGRMEIHASCRSARGAAWGPARQITASGGVDPRWSPAGPTILYAWNDALHLISADGGPSRELVRHDPRNAWGVPIYGVWSRDARTIYFKAFDAQRRASILAMPATGGPPRLLVRFDDPALPSYRREIGVDDRHLVFTIGRHESDVWTVEVVRR